MFKKGELVYHSDDIYINNRKDNVENRLYIVLFEIDNLVCTCPITSKINTFNSHNENYFLIPIAIKKLRKLYFAKIDNLSFKNSESTISTNITIKEEYVYRIINKIKFLDNSKYSVFLNYITKLENNNKYILNEEKRKRKQLRKEKRQNAKRSN